MPSAALRRLSPLQWAGVGLGGCAVLLALLGLLAPASAFFFPLLSLWASVGLFVLALCVLRVAGAELDFFHKAVVFGIWAVAVVYFYWTLSSRSFVYVWDYANYLLLAHSDMATIVDSLVAPLSVINALLVAISLKRQEQNRAVLEELETLWEQYRVYQPFGGEPAQEKPDEEKA